MIIEPIWSEIKVRLASAANQVGAEAVEVTTGEIVPGVSVERASGEMFHVKLTAIGASR
jgi:hypothetical protein